MQLAMLELPQIGKAEADPVKNRRQHPVEHRFGDCIVKRGLAGKNHAGHDGSFASRVNRTRLVQSVTLFNLTTMQRDLQNASSRQASLEVERQVGRLGTLSVGYSYLAGRNLLVAINQNVPSCVPSGTNNGCRPIPDYANDSRYSSAGASTYHALLVTFAQRRNALFGKRGEAFAK